MEIVSTVGKGRVGAPGILALCLALALIVVLPAPVLAVPQLPQRFQGSVTVNARPTPAGVQVSATISGVTEVFTATTDANGNYSLLYVKADDPDTPQKEGGVDGDIIQFFVSGTLAVTNPPNVTFSGGASTAVNLTITYSVSGTVYEAKGLALPNAVVTVDGTIQVTADTNGFYQVGGLTTGSHSVVAGKTGFRSVTKTVNVTDLTTTYTVDFKGPSSLVPNRPDLSYVLACINRWKFPPTDGTGPDLSKVLSVINAWKFPVS